MDALRTSVYCQLHRRRSTAPIDTADGCGIGFAVLGGAFAEEIDLPGSRLLGAFIATLGLPPVSAVNAEIERRLSAAFGSGYEYHLSFRASTR